MNVSLCHRARLLGLSKEASVEEVVCARNYLYEVRAGADAGHS